MSRVSFREAEALAAASRSSGALEYTPNRGYRVLEARDQRPSRVRADAVGNRVYRGRRFRGRVSL